MLEQAVDRVEGVDAVVLVVVRGDIGGAVAAHAGPEQPVDERVADGQVLDRDPVGGHADPVGPPELAVDHHPVAVAAADGHRGHGDLDLLAVGARADQDQVAGPGGVHRGLDGVVVLGHPPGHPAGPLHRLPGRAVALLARVEGDVADDHGGGHALAAVLGGVEGAVEAVHARLVEDQGGRLVGPDPLGCPPGAVDGHGVVRRPALVGEPDRGPGRHPGDLPGEEVVVHGHVDRAPRLLRPSSRPAPPRPGPAPPAGARAACRGWRLLRMWAGRRYLPAPAAPPASAPAPRMLPA